MFVTDMLYSTLFFFVVSLRSCSAVKCFVSRINAIDGVETGISRQECPQYTMCTLAEEIEETTNKRSKFRDCLNEKMCKLLELRCQFCNTDYCAPETVQNPTIFNTSVTDNINCVHCNTKNDSHCLTNSSPTLPCSKGEVCVTFSVTNFDGKNELERGCSNKEVCEYIGDFCSWCNSDGCLPRMPKVMYLRSPQMYSGSYYVYTSNVCLLLTCVSYILIFNR